MAATKTKTRKASTTKPAPKGRQPKADPKPARSRKAKPVEPAPEPEVDRGAAISEGMKELADVRTAARAKRNGTPAKQLIFDIWFKNIAGFSVDAVAKKFPEVKSSTIRAWVAYWRNNSGDGPGYPANAKNKTKEIVAALKKASA